MKNPRYEMIIWWSDEDEAFIVDVPELPGCMAHGNTRAKAIANAEEAVTVWIETAKADGIKVPSPRGRLLVA
jgi:predicted RNase H-like HicB family nuclease